MFPSPSPDNAAAFLFDETGNLVSNQQFAIILSRSLVYIEGARQRDPCKTKKKKKKKLYPGCGVHVQGGPQ